MFRTIRRLLVHRLALVMIKDPDLHTLICQPCPKATSNGPA